MTYFRNSIVVAAVFTILTACGPLEQGGIASQLGSVVTGGKIGGESGAASAVPVIAAPGTAALPTEELNAAPGKYIRVSARSFERWDTMLNAGSNGSRITFVDSANFSVTLENGLVVATRGLPRDLIAADVAQSWRAIQSGGGNSQRRHEFLTNLDAISTELLQCRIASQGSESIERLEKSQNATKFEEVCEGETFQFTNVYWVNGAGKIIRSLQAISPEAGYLQIDVF